MKETYYIYNNEAIASCILICVLHRVKSIDIARSCLILPFLLDDKTVNYLHKFGESDLSLEQLINEQARLFTTFNKRYLSLLPVAINAIIILKKSNQIELSNNISANSNTFISTNVDLGERLHKIIEVIPSFLYLTEKYTTLQLYQILNVQL